MSQGVGEFEGDQPRAMTERGGVNSHQCFRQFERGETGAVSELFVSDLDLRFRDREGDASAPRECRKREGG